MNNELRKLLKEQREQDNYHLSMETEFDFYRRIAAGDIDIVGENISFSEEEGMGVLSLNPIRNGKYHTIILIAMITRFCIEAGLESEEAYTLSDLYVRKVDETNDIIQIKKLRNLAIRDFARTMHELQNNNVMTLHVKRGIDYVSKNLTRPITSFDVGEAIGCNSDYLSRLFKKELGITLGDYILRRKCKAASYMLENSNESITEIAVFLGFSSTSHFIERFKKCMGVSPDKYRKNLSFSNK